MNRFEKIQTNDCHSIDFEPFDLESQLWRELSFYLDLRYLRKALKENFKGQAINEKRIDEKALNIQFCIRQAKDYMQSAKYSSIITKPVLIYYAFVSLSTALIIFKKIEKTLHSMPESHGLSMSYPERINDNTKNQFLKISAKFNNRGLFSELTNISLSDTYTMPLRYDKLSDASKDYLQTFEFSKVNLNLTEVDLSCLFSNLSEIWKECRLILNIENNIYSGLPILFNNELLFKISSQRGIISQNEIQNKLSILSSFTLYDSTNDNYFYKKIAPVNEIVMPLIKSDRHGTVFITANINNSIVSNDFMLQYLTFFILGSIARYKPETWRYILEDNIQGFGEIPNILCEASFIQIPLVVLKEFTKKHVNIKK